MASRKQIKELADRLISTIGNMEAEKADAIVRDVAETLYIDVLGMPGKVVVDQSKPVARVCGGKRAMILAEFKFQPDQEAG
jgi:hypothetical protein